MSRKTYIPDAGYTSLDDRCIRCRHGLDRIGRYCRSCLKSQRLKLAFGIVAVVQLSAAAFFVMRGTRLPHFEPNAGSHTVAVASPNAQSGWYYFDVTDPLIEDVTHHARLISNSPIAPKNAPATPGATSGTLEISASSHYGTTILLSFPTVKKACGANICQLTAIFDQQPPRTIPFHDVSDQRGTVLMLTEASGFVSALPKAHDLTIIAGMGTEQDTVLTFGVAGYRLQVAAIGGRIRQAAILPGGGGGRG
jgi:hypothetical protein